MIPTTIAAMSALVLLFETHDLLGRSLVAEIAANTPVASFSGSGAPLPLEPPNKTKQKACRTLIFLTSKAQGAGPSPQIVTFSPPLPPFPQRPKP